MHPILASRARLGLYLAAWVALEILLIGAVVAGGGIGWREAARVILPLYLLYAFACLSTWYVCRAVPLGLARPHRVAIAVAGAPLALSAAWTALAMAAGETLGAPLAATAPVLFTAGLLLALLSMALNYTLVAFERSREAEERAAAARLAAREAELRALKAQVNPHFLFNSLHSISALTSLDPAQARQMCILLADFLRLTLAIGDKPGIPLSEELALARSYLAVEKIRFRARLRVEEDLAPECGEVLVPPLLLQPLVENAVKHGAASLSEGAFVRISGDCSGGLLRLAVESNFDPEAPPGRSGGLGLKNVRERLHARYGPAARLDAGAREGLYRAVVEMPA